MFKKPENTFEKDFVSSTAAPAYSYNKKYTPNVSTSPMRTEKPKSWNPPEKLDATFQKAILKEDPETIIGEEVLFKGELSFNRFMRIEGYFEGTLISDGKVSIGPKGVVKSDIKLKEAIIEGLVEGNVTADRVELVGKAQVRGDIVAKSLSVDEGTTIIGQVKVVPENPSDG
jgi:cytoskeletal protein CcmA (bactofilin family)